MKYKPCCGGRCLLLNCTTREEGGCYCVCRLIDALHTVTGIIKDEGQIKYGAIYLPADRFREYMDHMTEEQKIARVDEKIWAMEEKEKIEKVLREKYIISLKK